MARREIKMEELVEVLSQWHVGRSISQIKRSVGLARKTVRKYLKLAEGYGFSRDSELQSYQYYLTMAGRIQQELRTPLESSASYKKTALYQNTIEKLLSKRYMTPKQVYRILKRDYEYPLSYSSFNRYINIKYPKKASNCIRIEVRAGEEAQVDFGGVGMMYDAERKEMRRAHAFIMTLSYSRFPYVEFVFDQGQRTWVKCHMKAFEYFGGVPERIVLDNLKSGILKPHTYDPIFNRAYAECAKHYGFVIDPTKVRMARHKGKVERKVPVVRQQFLSSHERSDIREANYEVKKWCCDEYGMEKHGTTQQKPYQVFREEEQPQLQKLSRERFDLPVWKEARVHPDHHVVFLKSYYSLPTRYIGKKVWVRGGLDTVQVFFDGELIKTHQRSYRPGSFNTDERDYPPEKSKYVLKTNSYYQREALQYGGYVCQVVRRVMKENAYRNLRKVQGIFRLADTYGSEALNLTCKRCLFYGDYRMSTIKRILTKKLYELPFDDEGMVQTLKSSAEGLSFIRSPHYFIHKEEVLS